MRCEPANTIITKLGGLTQVARMADITPNGVMRWRMPKDKRGTGGAVPHWYIPALMAGAHEMGVSLCLDDFYPHDAASPVSSQGGNKARSTSHHEKSTDRVSRGAAA